MTEVLRSPPQFPSSPSSPLSCSSIHASPAIITVSPALCAEADVEEEREGELRREGGAVSVREVEELSVLAFILTVLRKARCKTEGEEDARGMEIGWPTDVRHVTHVTFDRFHGFLGLPVEFEPEVPRRAPSASARVFGVSSESMQCSYDCRGNSVPTILLLMQRSLYEQGGLKAEGIFRINAENTHEEYVRDQLNSGVVPGGIDVHCLAGLIKAWFRELPCGVLDPLSPEQVMQCQTEKDCRQLVGGLPPTEASLLNWAINLMADVAQEEHENKMNARNVALVFAPNMTQMADPLTALMYAVQVMNFLKMLILRTLKERQSTAAKEDSKPPPSDPRDENSHQSLELESVVQYEEKTDQAFVSEDPILEDYRKLPDEKYLDAILQEMVAQTTVESSFSTEAFTNLGVKSRRTKTGQSSKSNQKKSQKFNRQPSMAAEKSKGGSILSRINSKSERLDAWR